MIWLLGLCYLFGGVVMARAEYLDDAQATACVLLIMGVFWPIPVVVLCAAGVLIRIWPALLLFGRLWKGSWGVLDRLAAGLNSFRDWVLAV